MNSASRAWLTWVACALMSAGCSSISLEGPASDAEGAETTATEAAPDVVGAVTDLGPALQVPDVVVGPPEDVVGAPQDTWVEEEVSEPEAHDTLHSDAVEDVAVIDDVTAPDAWGPEVLEDALEGDADVAEPLSDVDFAEPDVEPTQDAALDSASEEDTTAMEEDVGTPPVVEPPDYEGTCCALNGTKGCDDPDCAEAICAHDPYCCAVTWDVTCALCAMGKSIDGGCMGLESACLCDVDAAEPCCETHASPLCDSPYCVAAVCALDTYCCETSWDTYCVQCAQGEATYGGTSCANVDSSCGCEPPPVEPEEPEEPTHFELAEAWAPVWYHDTDDTSYESDYITAYDFDGDTISNNNWENVFTASADLGAVVYWSVVETMTHWYILYTDFHPRDWTENCDPLLPFLEPCHENDMEGAMVMVKKDDSEFGEFVLLVTEAHNILHIFTNDPAITAKETNQLEDVGVSFEGERHPKLYVESKGHGVCALDFDGPDHCQHPVGPGVNPFPGGDGIVYRYKGQAEVPSSGNDQDVGYALVSFYDTIWQQRHSICDGACTFDGTFNYQGKQLAKAFNGDTWGEDKANPPWAWDDPNDGAVYRGDFFFRPASSVKIWLNIPGWTSTSYAHNLFLDEL